MIRHGLTHQQLRARRVRSKLHGTATQPRVSVFRSNRWTYAQAIDDDKAVTIVAFKTSAQEKANKVAQALAIGKLLGAALKDKKITSAIFDRGGYRYIGRVRAVAEGLRHEGIAV